MEIQNKRLSNETFEQIRREVLAQWPTGKDVDLQEAVEYTRMNPLLSGQLSSFVRHRVILSLLSALRKRFAVCIRKS